MESNTTISKLESNTTISQLESQPKWYVYVVQLWTQEDYGNDEPTTTITVISIDYIKRYLEKFMRES